MTTLVREPSILETRWPKRWQWLFIGVVASLTALSAFSLPFAPNDSLDSSWQLVLGHAWSHDFIFGRDIVYTYGPWGFLTTAYFHPDTFWLRVGWDFVEKIVAGVVVARLALRLGALRATALILVSALVLPLFYDAIPMFLIAAALVWCNQPGRTRRDLVAAGMFVAFLSLQKFTYLLMTACGAGGVVGTCMLRREPGRAGWLAGSVICSFLGGWIVAGQPLSALSGFLRHTLAIASGYPAAMYWNETDAVFYLGLGCCLLYVSVVWLGAERRALPMLAALTGFGFLSWKHGFTRADAHTFGFFQCMLVAGTCAPLLHARRSRLRSVTSWGLIAAAFAGGWASIPEWMGNAHRLLVYHVTDNAGALMRLGSRHAALRQAYDTVATQHRLPQVAAVVKDASVDQFGHEQAILLFNKLNYHPRPVFQSFHAYSESLFQLNEATYVGDDAPAYTLARLQTIDGRFPALDDSWVLRRLVTDHSVARRESGFLLLRRNRTPTQFAPIHLSEGRLRYATEQIDLRPYHGRAIWARIDCPFSWIGWIRSVLYKPPEVRLIVADSNGVESSYRLVVPAARSGFLLSPTLIDTRALDDLITFRTAVPAEHIRIEIDPEHRKFFLKRARYELSAVPDLDFSVRTRASP